MRKNKLLNSNISCCLSTLGHKDQIVIADAGLPIPKTCNRIDLALKKGVPSFIETLKVIVSELYVEAVVLAEEIKTNNPDIHMQIKEIIPNCEVVYVDHENFKAQTELCHSIIRTGEFTPFANIILVAGVDFNGDYYD